MKNLKITVAALLLFAVLAGIGVALTPPPPPPPPVGQNLGLYDTSIDFLVTNATDQGVCRQCHQTSGTNISGGYNNTVGGVPTRHHSMVQRGVINPMTNAPFACTDCHPSTPGVGNGILLDRSCLDCHNGTSFSLGNSLGGHVGNFSRPHHIITNYTEVVGFGNPAANRTCKTCHGSFVDNYNDGHYKPSYATDSFITPYATFKITNFSQPDGLGGNKTWGGCQSCHVDNPAATPLPIGENHHNHHKEILGFGLDPSGVSFGGTTPFQNASTPFVNVANKCAVCHVIDYTNSTGNGNTFALFLTRDVANPTAPGGIETLIDAAEVRNSTIEQGSPALEPGTVNITINGTGCEKCHGVPSLHNIQNQYVQNGPQGKGHINNNSDCSGCHDSWLPVNDFVPGALIPTVNSVNPSVIAAGTATTLTVTGTNFVNDAYTSVVTIDGVSYTPSSITDSQIVVSIPALSAGAHQLQLVKGGDKLSKLSVLTVVPATTITSAKLSKGIITITGTGFGVRPANAQYYVSVKHAGNQIISTSVTAWSNTQIKAKNSGAAIGDVVTVMTADSGEVITTIS